MHNIAQGQLAHQFTAEGCRQLRMLLNNYLQPGFDRLAVFRQEGEQSVGDFTPVTQILAPCAQRRRRRFSAGERRSD